MGLNPLPPILNRLRMEMNYEIMIWFLTQFPKLTFFFITQNKNSEKEDDHHLTPKERMWYIFTLCAFHTLPAHICAESFGGGWESWDRGSGSLLEANQLGHDFNSFSTLSLWKIVQILRLLGKNKLNCFTPCRSFWGAMERKYKTKICNHVLVSVFRILK